MDRCIGKEEWYGEEDIECPWRDMTCNVKPELRPAPLCLCCMLGSIRAQFEEIDTYFFNENLRRD